MRWPFGKADRDLEREVRHHLETLADAYERQGMSREEAMRQARIEFGGVEGIKDECRDEHAGAWLAHVWQDVHFGWRMMRKTPAITLAAIVSLALGIGATTAILGLAYGLLWRPLGVPAPRELVELLWASQKQPDGLVSGSFGGDFDDGPLSVRDFFSEPAYQAMRKRLAGRAQVSAHIGSSLSSATVGGQVLIARVRGVTGNFFSMFELRPFQGRLLIDSDDDGAAQPVIVVTHRFWMRHLGGDRKAVGSPIRINNTVYTIVGVLPPEFTGIIPAEETDFYCTIPHSPFYLEPKRNMPEWTQKPTTWWMQLMARRAQGVTDEELRGQLQAAFAATWSVQPKSPEETPAIRVADASTGLGRLRRQFGDPVWMLLGLVALVLLVACANIANLLLARAAEREKEVVLRISLGCSAPRLLRQFFTESLMLALIGGVLSIGVAAVLGALMPGLIPDTHEGMTMTFEPDARSIVATAAVTLITALLFGLYPAWRASRIDSSPALKEGSGNGGTVSRERWLPARLLVLFQVALGVLLFASAIVYTSNLNQLVNRDTGFDRGNSILFELRPGEVGYTGGRLKQFYFDLEDRLNQTPGIEAAGIALTRPMRGGGYYSQVTLPGQAKGFHTAVHHVTAPLFISLGVPIVAGRGLTRSEVRTGAKVMVISEDLAKDLNTQSPLGMQLLMGDQHYTVVGVARHARYAHMGDESAEVVYLPFEYDHQSATIVARTSIAPLAALASIRQAIKELDPNLPMVDIYTMEQQISRTLQRERLFAWLCGSFGVLALVLCVVGLYGLMSHMTARRTPEMGIRMALGASRGDVLRQVVSEGMKLASFGLLLGIPLAVWAARIAKAQELLPEGPLPYEKLAAALGVLAISAVVAVLGPAIRAAAVDPMQALRRG